MTKTIMDLEPEDCRFIVSSNPTTYCAKRAVSNYSWCREHRKLVFQHDRNPRARSPLMLPVEMIPHAAVIPEEPEPEIKDASEVMEDQS